MRKKGLVLGIVTALLSGANNIARADELRLGLPLDCTLGETCFVQNYVDHDPSAGWQDYHCGHMTYDGHDGTDFRLQSMAAVRAGVAVIAAAPGRVLRVRDGVADLLLDAPTDKPSPGEECGNMVIIDHGDGWHTQYCHMQKGSLLVKPGDKVQRGQTLGRVGASGATAFPHLHLSLRHYDVVIDPFAPDLAPDACSTTPSRTLFDTKGQDYSYRDHIILNTGFTDGPVTVSEVENDTVTQRPMTTMSANLVAFVRVIGLAAGDVQNFAIIGPEGEPVVSHKYPALERPQAQNFLYIGWKKPAEGWKPGIYAALYSVDDTVGRRFTKWFYLRI
jgi:Peptidase family M23